MSKDRITLAELAEDMRELREGLFALRADLRDALNAAEILAKRREKDRQRHSKKDGDLPRKSAEIRGKERKDGEERNLPPTPPIKREEGERKEVCLSSTCVCARTEDDPIRPCTFAQLLSAAKTYRANIDEAYVRDVYNKFVASGWRDVKGKAFNPCGLITAFIDNRKRFERLQDPDRIPDARKGFKQQQHQPRKPDNWIGRELREEERVLG